jgi:hypothetical protein
MTAGISRCPRCETGFGTPTGHETERGVEIACGNCGEVWYLQRYGVESDEPEI